MHVGGTIFALPGRIIFDTGLVSKSQSILLDVYSGCIYHIGNHKFALGTIPHVLVILIQYAPVVIQALVKVIAEVFVDFLFKFLPDRDHVSMSIEKNSQVGQILFTGGRRVYSEQLNSAFWELYPVIISQILKHVAILNLEFKTEVDFIAQAIGSSVATEASAALFAPLEIEHHINSATHNDHGIMSQYFRCLVTVKVEESGFDPSYFINSWVVLAVGHVIQRHYFLLDLRECDVKFVLFTQGELGEILQVGRVAVLLGHHCDR